MKTKENGIAFLTVSINVKKSKYKKGEGRGELFKDGLIH